ncbi:MAG: oligosaccharide repeat unit polymerase [Bacteroidaceae bacterium]|nr:oligosaccharide repeat unit polymerase [Bacteroidaceae bacterium]
MAVYISMLYVITSFCGVLMVMGGFLSSEGGVLIDGWEPEFDIKPTILYCGLITLTILPFSFVRPEKLEDITNVHRYIIYAFTFFVLLQGGVMYFLVGEFVSDLLNGDFRFIKEAHYAGDISPADVKMLTMPLPIQIMYLLSSITLLALPLFFYYSCIEKRSLWLTLPLLAVSISPILRGVVVADRTEIIHYGLMFFFCLVFFQKVITRKIRKFFLICSIPTIAIGLIYFLAVSTSRFEDQDEGAEGSLLEYAGQSYANFCYFYEHHNSELYYIERELPITSYFLFKSQYTETKEERSAKEGFFIGVFASHVGSWMLDTGLIGSVVISVLFAMICCLVIHRYNRTKFDIADVMMLYVLGAIPTFGIFYYRYYTIATAFIYVAAGVLFLCSKIVFIWEKDKIENTTLA